MAGHTHRHKLIERVVGDFVEVRRQLLNDPRVSGGMRDIDQIAAELTLAARLEALEDALVSGLPTAGEGV